MPGKSILRITLLAAAVAFSVPVFAAAGDPTIQQVYVAAEAGKLDEAQTMMQQVLHDHPNSGKAHFVEAELLAKQGRLSAAEAELGKAEQLAPGLPFAKPAAVQNLKARIAASHGARSSSQQPQSYQQAPAPVHSGSGFPWGLLIVAAILIGFIGFAVRFMSRRNNVNVYGGGGNAGYGPSYGPGGGPVYGPGGGGGAMMGGPMAGPVGGGLGSGIVGGLATGAAMGAGLVAGEALMHHFTDGDRNSGNNTYVPPQQNTPPAVPDDNMGGYDFGLNDDSSWDDGSSGGGGGGGSDDW